MDYKSLTLSQQTFVRFLFALYFVGLQFSAAQQCKSILSVRDDVIEGPFVQEMTATTTPPFPENGAGKRPVFDGVELLLLGHATPPDMLQHHIARLGAEFKDDEHRKQFSWPEMSDELEKLLSPESISSWDFDLFRLNELTKGRPLAVLAFALIHMHGLMTKLKIDETVLKR